jgi:hypothetical protein
MKGDNMTCGPFQELQISDGTTTVNLLSPRSSFCLLEWQPSLAEPKGGGVWRDSTLAEGRRLAMRRRANAIDTLTLAVRNWTPDDLIQDTQDLRRLLEKAYQYSTTSWQDEPVWIKRHPINATYPEYTIIYDYRTPQDGNPHGSEHFWTGLAKASFPEFVLILEHEGFWRSDQPGTGTCVQTSGLQEDWLYEPWTVNTNQPASQVYDMIELSTGRMLAGDANECWRTDNGVAWNAATAKPSGTVVAFAVMDGGVYNGQVYALVGNGVDKSVDNGVNWAGVTAAFQSGYWTDQMISHNAMLYATGTDGGGTHGIWSKDGAGGAWTDLVVEMAPPGGGGPLIVADDGYIYGGMWTNGLIPYIVRSSNGTTWYKSATLGYSMIPRDFLDATDGLMLLVTDTVNNEVSVWMSSWPTWYKVADVPYLTDADQLLELDDGRLVILGEVSGTGAVSTAPSETGVYFWQTCVIAGSTAFNSGLQYSGNSRIYAGENGDIYWSPALTSITDMGRTATCTDEVFVANKQNVANVTHVKRYDSSETSYTDLFPMAGGFPVDLFPDPVGPNDAIYFGIESAVCDSGPFCSLVFDLSSVFLGASYTLTWEYSDGGAGWPTLNVQDGTRDFSVLGVNSVHWVPPSDWAVEAVNLVTALWVRARITSPNAMTDVPAQDNREIYTVNWPRADVDELQVAGDIPALAQIKFRNRSDEDGYDPTVDELDLLENRVVVGLRSLDRGDDFVAYLNCADEQNPVGVTVTAGTNTAFGNDIEAPTGRRMVHTTDGASAWSDECTFTLDTFIARDFYGSFHAYLRAQQVDWDTEIDEVRVRLQVRTGSGGVTFTTDHKPFRNLNDWQLLDLGGVDIPASGLFSSDDLADETELVIQVWSSVAALTVNLYDLILIPTDEWALDAVDKALRSNSGVANGYLLDVDSVTYPKRDIKVFTRQVGSDRVRSTYQTNTPGPAILQANADQRLWFLTARGVVLGSHTGANNQPVLTDANASFLTSGVAAGQYIYNLTDTVWGIITAVTATTVTATTLAGAAFDWDTNEEYIIVCPNWRSEPWNAHSVQVVANARYLSMRGAR